ncbi:MAG: arginine--tRNA ligase [Bacteriovoracaceae bacterium]|nr:arginine--tRNA ligase [Bacteriovoracaceae bacterium]
MHLKQDVDMQEDALKNEIATSLHGIIKSLAPDSSDFTLEFVRDLIEFPQDSSKGDYAFPCFRLAKVFRKKPLEIADSIKAELDNSDNKMVSEVVSVAGFLNLFVNKKNLASEFFNSVEDESYFTVGKRGPNAQKRVMVEYSQPNTHKEFHVGHGRNVCLGDSICRLYRYVGFNTIGANYIGDEGTHIAKCLFAVRRSSEDIPATGRAEWLGQRYVEANRILEEASEEEKTEYHKEISQILSDIESKEGETYNLWKETRSYCMDDFMDIYNWLDVHFDHFFYESEVSEAAQEAVAHYMKEGLLYEDQGAIGRDMSDAKLGFLMVRKSDGNTLYITKDIALAKQKFEQFKIDHNIYVVGNEQDFHFKQLFHFLNLAKFENADKCDHLSYGMVKRPDGKMSSRLGNSFTFFDLISIVQEKLDGYLEKYQGEWSEEQITDTKRLLAVGAIKYGMLSTDPKRDIVFEPENWTRFDGNSGPYLMYSYTRCQSILEKAKSMGISPSNDNLEFLETEVEGQLIFSMFKFNSIVSNSLEQMKPSNVCTYLYELCKTFSQFYVQVNVLKEENKDKVAARLALIETFAKVLKEGLNLIGITPPKKM